MGQQDQPGEANLPPMRAQDYSEVEDWPGYFGAVLGKGTRDSWALLPDRMHHSRDEVLKLLEGFEIEVMNEEEKDDPPDVRKPKHWQLFHVVARKR